MQPGIQLPDSLQCGDSCSAALKMKLAEKDAQGHGGFGAPSKLAMGELPRPARTNGVPPINFNGR